MTPLHITILKEDVGLPFVVQALIAICLFVAALTIVCLVILIINRAFSRTTSDNPHNTIAAAICTSLIFGVIGVLYTQQLWGSELSTELAQEQIAEAWPTIQGSSLGTPGNHSVMLTDRPELDCTLSTSDVAVSTTARKWTVVLNCQERATSPVSIPPIKNPK